MSRMDKYNDEEYENDASSEEVYLSRVDKNHVMYDDVYFNRTRISLDGITENEDNIKKEEIKELPKEEKKYEKKSYSLNEYLEKARENKSPDNLKREIDDVAFKEQEDEIRKLIDSINEKEENEDFFKDLKGDDENTTVGAKFKTDEFNDSIYETLKNDKTIDENSILEHALGDKTVLDLKKDEEDKIDHTFEKIMIEDDKIQKKRNILPVVIFCILLFTLILIVAIIILFK